MKNRTGGAWLPQPAWLFAATLMFAAGPCLQAQAGGEMSGKPASDAAKVAPGSSAAVIRQSATEAQQRCYELGHDNMDEYVSCTDALFRAVKGAGAKASSERLGILYFGWVGAEHWSRVGMPGSREAAKHYFTRYRPLQQQLAISDQSLCAAVAGDCTVRLAQVAAAVKEFAAPPPRARPSASARRAD